MSKENKPFFLKRWFDAFLKKIEGTIFAVKSERGFTMVIPILGSLIGCLLFGLARGIRTMFKIGDPDNKFDLIAAIVVLVIIVCFIVVFLIKDLPSFESTGKKVGRSVYTVLLCGVAAVIGYYGGRLVVFIAIGACALWVFFQLVLAGPSKKSKEADPENEKELKVERGECGEEYYVDSSEKKELEE